ncbi:hypothetical protein MMC19_001144 [Ptychographa xylographoides]|nr:hypothetical protein [Ptychographa xylographoides]
MYSSVLTLLSLSALAHSYGLHKRANASDAWVVERFSSLLTFGDSYTDENRLNYFGGHNGTAPPNGTLLPESFGTAGGGRTWARYVIQYTGSSTPNGTWDPQMILYDYAVSGAVCSNEITPRIWSSINANFPSVVDYEIPAFLNDSMSDQINTTEPYFTPALTGQNAVYVMWIGTNDLGVDAYLTDSQVPGNTLTNYIDCVFGALDSLYAAGGRYFVVNNVIPLQLTRLYANDTAGEAGPNHYWPDKPANHTAISEQMAEYATTVDAVYKYRIPYEVQLANRYPGANFAMFDVYSLIMDIFNNPTEYLNGSAPANVTGFQYHCDLTGMNCVDTAPDSPDSFLFYDELHPSEQTDRIIAKNFVDVLNGNSTYATYY